jgi:hypothetical protein
MAVQEKRIHQDIETINGFNATPGNGTTRLEDIILGGKILPDTAVALAV